MRLGLVVAILGFAVATKLPLCPFAIVTRHPCPGCGLTRATLALLQGDLHAALHFHPLSPVVVPLVIAALLYNGVSYLRRGKWEATEGLMGRRVTVAGAVLGVLVFVVWIARFFGAFGGPVPV